MKFFQNSIKFLCSLMLLATFTYQASASTCFTGSPLDIRTAIKSYPSQDGKCTYLLVLEDTGADGWDGASLDVSIAEAWPATNYKMTSADGNCKYIPLYVGDGETIDFNYWNGAFESQHGMALYAADGTSVFEYLPGGSYAGIPANEPIRVKASCPTASCAGSTLDLEFTINEAAPVSTGTGYGSVNADILFLEVQDDAGNTVYSNGPASAASLLDGLSATLNKCETYTLIFGNTSGGSGWDGASLTVEASEDAYNNNGGDFLDAIFPNVNGGMAMYNFTIPCAPADHAPVEVLAYDCDTAEGFNVPFLAPEICYGTCHVDCTSGVTIDVFLDGTYVDFYTYSYPEGFNSTNSPGNQPITAYADAGVHTLTYKFTYNCEDLAGQQIMVTKDVPVHVATATNPTLTCNDLLHVSLVHGNNNIFDGSLCDVTITPDMVLEAIEGCESEYVVNVSSTGGNYVTSADAGNTVVYTVTHLISGNVCWGEIKVEDKQDPVLNCHDYDLDCTHPNALDEDYCADSEACTSQGVIIKEGIPVTADFGSLGCTPNGEIIKKVCITIDVDHTRPYDLRFYLNTPNHGSIYVGAMTTGTKTFCSTATNQAFGSMLAGLVGESYSSLGDLTLEIRDVDPTVDYDHYHNPTAVGTGYGTFESACITVSHGFPTGYDVWDCTATEVTLINEMIAETNCDQSDWNGAQIIRTYQAVDAFGNSSICTQTVNLKAPTMDAIEKPGDLLLECDGSTADDITPAVSGGLSFGCFDLTDDLHTLCDLSYTYEDVVLPICGDGFKIIRTWTLINWCSGVQKTHVQVIKVEDTTGPEIAQENITIGTDAYSCDADVAIADLGITDDCSGLSQATASYISGGGAYDGSGQLIIVDLTNGGTIENLPLGDTEILISAKDACLNASEKLITVTVIDDTTPIAICDDELHVSLGGDGEAWLFADAVDEGSYDNCGDVTLEVRRPDGKLGDTWSDSVPFDCEDLGQLIVVELRVTDAAGNYNICWKEALIEDALPPVITCPADKTFECDDAAIHSPFGEAVATDNCSATISHIDNLDGLDNCGAGDLTRTFTATDGSDKSADVSCTQTITILHVSDFNVIFPEDVTLTNCELTDTGAPIIGDDDCELVAISSDDQIFDIVSDACYKIERTWTIVNWCVYDENGANNTNLGISLADRTYRDDGDGYFKYVQTIKVLDEFGPVIDNPGDLTFCDLTDGCEGEAELRISATDACTLDPNDLEFSFKIDANNDGTFDIVGQGNDASAVYPYGTHRIKWLVEDGCGNEATSVSLFTIEDCKKPTPVCLNGISIPTMNSDGCVEIWASDLLEYAFDNCSEDAFVEESVKIALSGSSVLSPNLTLCCDQVGTVLVDIWVSDEAGNTDFCSTYILLQDNSGVCGGGAVAASIAGHIETEQGDMVEQAMIDISGGVSNALPTGATGTFAFPNLSTGATYTITPEKDINPLNGVSTFDLVLMSKHILGTDPLNTPYQLIAADVNNDGNVTTFDVVQTRQLILYIVTDFPSNTSWRFVDMDYSFPVPTNPWSQIFPEAIDYNSLTSDELLTDFIGVKIGDVSGDAVANQLMSADDRNATDNLTFAIDDAEMTAGQSYTVDFRASDFNAVAGYQFTLNFDADAVSFEGVEAGALNISEGNFGMTMLDNGVITTSYNSVEAVSVDNDAVLFSMTFAANTAANLSEVLSLTSRYTAAEAYNADADLMDVTLTFNTPNGTVVAGGDFELYQNRPNPFADATVIGFNLPTASTATLKVMDVAGRTLKVVSGDFARGYNEVNINSSDLNVSGVLYYTLETANNSATKKMVILK